MMYLPDNVKIIICHRDPRDSWADIIGDKVWYSKYGMPLEAFIAGRKNTENCVNYNSDKIMHVQFEEFCLKHEEYRKKILEFVGLSENETLATKKFFDPKISGKNIGIYKNIENKEAILKIEQELKEYCFYN